MLPHTITFIATTHQCEKYWQSLHWSTNQTIGLGGVGNSITERWETMKVPIFVGWNCQRQTVECSKHSLKHVKITYDKATTHFDL